MRATPEKTRILVKKRQTRDDQHTMQQKRNLKGKFIISSLAGFRAKDFTRILMAPVKKTVRQAIIPCKTRERM
jgi:hypothetical protein